MPDLDDDHITCATYTHARRHPMVIGQIGGWTPPFQLSVTQIAVLIVAIWLEYQTWPYWLGYLPPPVALLLAAVIPSVLTWGVRRARIEGRSLPRTALGWISLLSVPRPGKVGGRAYRGARAAPMGRAAVLVARGEVRQ
jgi:hypothetical protein